jgi:chitinase
VSSNNLDGVDINYNDINALQTGTAEAWLITFTTKLRQLLPNYIICHTINAGYFKSENFIKGGYITVHNQVGNAIDFYNVIYYNQGTNAYNNYTQLFIQSSGALSGTSVTEIIARGVPSKKIIVGKPSTAADASGTGYVDSITLGQWITQAYK